MQKITIKIILVLLLFLEVVFAGEIDLESEKYILYNLNDNSILTSEHENDETSIASLTKIMTTIVAIEHIDDFNKKVTITGEMINDIAWDVATAGFTIGEKVTYDDLLYGAILPSGADAVNALAISISGSYDDFINLMNDKVKQLNLKNTHFSNVVGLYSKNNYSSAYDMAQILIYALKNKKFKSVFESRNYTFSNGKKVKSTIEKYNSKSNSNISYITGSKTGYIKKAGYCLASTATLNDVNYLLITLNAFSDTSNVHIKDHIKTYSYYNDNYGYKNIVNKDDIVATLKTKNSKEDELAIVSGEEIKKYLKNTFDKSKVTYEYDGIDEISYFTRKGTKLGHVKINYEGKTLSDFDLIYNQELHFSIFAFIWDNILIIIVIIFVIFIFKRAKKIQRRRKRRKQVKR